MRPAHEKAQFREIFGVSRETIDRLERYEVLLRRWSPKINLVSASTLDHIWNRHFLDSAQIHQLVEKKQGIWLDFGSGAGFPGLVAALLAHGAGERLDVILCESDTRKVAFLKAVRRDLNLTFRVENTRVESLAPQNADIISARAVAALTDLMAYAQPHLAPGGICLFPKGRSVHKEIDAAKEVWRFDYQAFDSIVDPDAKILKIGAFHRA